MNPVLSDAALSLILEAAANGTPQTMTARGGSMGASIPDGAKVELSPPEQPRPGDVLVLWPEPERFLIHRCVGERGDGALLVKGDACPKPDGWFRPDEVRAVVHWVDRGRGWEPPTFIAREVPPLWRRALSKLARSARG